MVIGWMNSANPMTISSDTGVAYDPSCVQHQVRVTQSLTKGLVFGVLDVKAAEIVWLEMPFDGQTSRTINREAVEGMLKRLDSKLSVGRLLTIKAEAQGMYITDTADADEIYDRDWAINAAAVTKLLVD